MFETVIVAALRNKTDRFVQLDSSAKHTLWLLPNCNVTVPESYEKCVAGSRGCTVYTSPGSCVETIVSICDCEIVLFSCCQSSDH